MDSCKEPDDLVLEMRDVIGYPDIRRWENAIPAGEYFGCMVRICRGSRIEGTVPVEGVPYDEHVLL